MSSAKPDTATSYPADATSHRETVDVGARPYGCGRTPSVPVDALAPRIPIW